MRTIQRRISGGLLVSKDGKIFFGQHRTGGAYEGCWIIPGGGIDIGETEVQALHREMLEETGIDTSTYPTELVGTATGSAEKTLKDTGERVIVDMTFHDFRIHVPMDAADIPPAPDDELGDSRWFSVEELQELTFSPPTEALLRKLELIDIFQLVKSLFLC